MKPLIAYPHEIRNALANGRGQFRRIVKPTSAESERILKQAYDAIFDDDWQMFGLTAGDHYYEATGIKAPYQPGDLIWVRETCATYDAGKAVCYRTDWDQEGWDGLYPSLYKKRSPIHMPRWASRLTLRVTGVRVERLQEIGEEDAIAEGAPPSHPSIDAVSRQFGYPDFPRSWFAQTWESIHGKGSWDANPWVMANEFEVVR